MQFEEREPLVSTTATGSARRRLKPALLTRRELAALLHVVPMTITKWEQAGMPIATRGRKGKPSRYRETVVRSWLQQREEDAQRPGSVTDVAKEKARLAREQADLTLQTRMMRARDLLPREEVERAWTAEVAAVRAKLLAWPATLADQVHRAAVLDGLGGVERVLNEAIRNVLRELAHAKASTPESEAEPTDLLTVQPTAPPAEVFA